MSDDGWFGEPQEPTPGPTYGQGRRAARGRPPEPGQSGQYAQPGQYGQPGHYTQQYAQDSYQPQDPYQAADPYQPDPYPSGQYQPDQYSQDYAAQPQSSYYDELGPRSNGQDWNTAQHGYPSHAQQPQPPQASSYPHHTAQPQAPQSSDPYASGSYGTGSYTSGTYSSSSDAYASDAYRPPAAPSDPYEADRNAPPTDRYGSGTYGRPAARDANGSGAYATGARDGYSTGGYPVAGAAGAAGPEGAAAPGRRRAAAASANAATGTQNGYGRGDEYMQYQDEDDEFPSRNSRRATASGYGVETDSRADGLPASGARSRRRGAAVGIEPDDDRFSLIDDEDEEGDAGSGRGGRKPKQKRGRNCLAVFLAFSVIAGGLGYGGYKGVQWYQSKYGPAPDYVSTAGTGTKVAINIPSGSGGRTIGGLLFNAGVIKSQRAFTDACNANPQCANIEAGTYLLPQGISAAASITDLLDPKNRDTKSQLITYGGERAAQIFASLESKTGWSDADIRTAIASGKIDLPPWDTAQPGAKTPYAHIEGFLASESYTLTDYKTPTDLLKKMVDDQLAVFSQEGFADKAARLGVTEYKLLIIASLARAEAGTNVSDLNKIAGVVFNRFNNPMQFAHLGFDTSTLYGMGNTGTVPDNKDTTNPYNTSVFGIKGLPPGPIDNPDQPALDAAANPNRANKYFYFCATPDGVQYASTNEQWQALGAKYKGLCGSRG